MKPPSGFARRNGGCRLFLGCKSATALTFLNSGTDLFTGGLFCRRGDLGSLAKLPSRFATADEG